MLVTVLPIVLATLLLLNDPPGVSGGADSASVDTLIASRLTEADIDAAIECGRAKKEFFGFGAGTLAGGLGGAILKGNLPVGESAFGVSVQGPWGRVATAAGVAAKKYLPFGREEATAAMLAPIVTVVATPKAPVLQSGTWFKAPNPIHVVIQARKTKSEPEAKTVQALFVQSFDVTWTNLSGGSMSGQGIRALFDEKSLPAGDFEIVLVCKDGREPEIRYLVRGKDRTKLR